MNATSDADALKVIGIFSNSWKAHIALGVLEENGIEAIIDNEIMSSTLPLGFNGVRVLVRRSDADEAQQLITPLLRE